MGLFGRAKSASDVERRVETRLRADCPATLLMPSGNRPGQIHDISESGARFITDNPPRKGSEAILEWSQHETYCQVVWIASGMCGLQFERPIPTAIVNATALPVAPVESGPVASSDRIPLGRKRSQLRHIP